MTDTTEQLIKSVAPHVTRDRVTFESTDREDEGTTNFTFHRPRESGHLLSKEFLRDLGCHIDLGRGHLFFENLGVRAVVTSEQSQHLLFALDEFWTTGTQDPG